MATMNGHVKKGDSVKVVAGRENGKIGTVLRVMPPDKVIVENLNKVKRHQKPSGAMKQGGVIDKEMPLHVSNVMVVCKKCTKPARIKRRKLEDGTKVRVCSKCKEVIDA